MMVHLILPFKIAGLLHMLRLCSDCNLPRTYFHLYTYIIFLLGFDKVPTILSSKIRNLGHVAENVIKADIDNTESHRYKWQGYVFV